MATFLWDGGDGEEPALTMDAEDIDVLLFLLDAYRERPPDERGRWPDADDLSRVGGWLALWKRAQSRWAEVAPDGSEPDSPF